MDTLRHVMEREEDRILNGGPSFTYKDYLIALKSSASRLDEKLGIRSISNMDVHNLEQDYERDQNDDDDAYDVHVSKFKGNRRTPGASMNKETWSTISDEGKAVWDKLTPTDKSKILSYAKQRAEKPIQANNHEITEDEVPGDDIDDPGEILDVNKVVSEARGEAHPGDVRRMMGSDNTKPTTKQSVNKAAKVNHLNWVDQACEDYWNTDNQDF